jgi:hypothetical protein
MGRVECGDACHGVVLIGMLPGPGQPSSSQQLVAEKNGDEDTTTLGGGAQVGELNPDMWATVLIQA